MWGQKTRGEASHGGLAFILGWWPKGHTREREVWGNVLATGQEARDRLALLWGVGAGMAGGLKRESRLESTCSVLGTCLSIT